MKKQILLATSAALLCGSAWASKARMDALGQDRDRGSYYLDDTRNVFHNPAHVAGMNNYAITEWGTSADANDTATAPGAEGGFFKTAGNFSYGLYFGSDHKSQNDVRSGGTGYAGTTTIGFGNAGFADRDNELDLFFAGDMGVEWGVRLSYAGSKDEKGADSTSDVKHSSFSIGLGAVMGDLEAYANIGLSDKSEGVSSDTNVKWEGTTALDLGLGYAWNHMNFFANYQAMGGEYTSGSGVAKNETTRNTITVGVAKVKKLSSTSTMLMDVRFTSVKSEDKDGTTSTASQETKDTRLPFTMAFETDATSWLTLRGSLSQPIFINSTETKTNSASTKASNANATTVAAGATLNFGKLKVDGTIGNTGNDGASNGTQTGILSLDRLMTTVAVHYWF